MRALVVFILSAAQCVAITRAVDCFSLTNPGTSLHLCDRWIACRDSGGMSCDRGDGVLTTTLCVSDACKMRVLHVCILCTAFVAP